MVPYIQSTRIYKDRQINDPPKIHLLPRFRSTNIIFNNPNKDRRDCRPSASYPIWLEGRGNIARPHRFRGAHSQSNHVHRKPLVLPSFHRVRFVAYDLKCLDRGMNCELPFNSSLWHHYLSSAQRRNLTFCSDIYIAVFLKTFIRPIVYTLKHQFCSVWFCPPNFA